MLSELKITEFLSKLASIDSVPGGGSVSALAAALAAALSRDIPVAEYAPRKIKQSITGAGNASKEQVAAMVARTLDISMDQMPKELDATDGLAVALCHHFQLSSPRMQSGYSGWKAFVEEQSDRVVS